MKTSILRGLIQWCVAKQKRQTNTSSKTKLFKIHQRVFSPTVPLKIILPEDWFVVLLASLDSANPVVLVAYMLGLDMAI